MQKIPNDRRMDVPLDGGRDKLINSLAQETKNATWQGRNKLRDDAMPVEDARMEDEGNFVPEKQQSTEAKDEMMTAKDEILKRERENEKLKLIRKNRKSRWNDIL